MARLLAPCLCLAMLLTASASAFAARAENAAATAEQQQARAYPDASRQEPAGAETEAQDALPRSRVMLERQWRDEMLEDAKHLAMQTQQERRHPGRVASVEVTSSRTASVEIRAGDVGKAEDTAVHQPLEDLVVVNDVSSVEGDGRKKAKRPDWLQDPLDTGEVAPGENPFVRQPLEGLPDLPPSPEAGSDKVPAGKGKEKKTGTGPAHRRGHKKTGKGSTSVGAEGGKKTKKSPADSGSGKGATGTGHKGKVGPTTGKTGKGAGKGTGVASGEGGAPGTGKKHTRTPAPAKDPKAGSGKVHGSPSPKGKGAEGAPASGNGGVQSGPSPKKGGDKTVPSPKATGGETAGNTGGKKGQPAVDPSPKTPKTPSPTDTPTPKPKTSPGGDPIPKPKTTPGPDPKPKETPSPEPKTTPSPTDTPTPKPKPTEHPTPDPKTGPTPTSPTGTPTSSPGARNSTTGVPSPVVYHPSPFPKPPVFGPTPVPESPEGSGKKPVVSPGQPKSTGSGSTPGSKGPLGNPGKTGQGSKGANATDTPKHPKVNPGAPGVGGKKGTGKKPAVHPGSPGAKGAGNGVKGTGKGAAKGTGKGVNGTGKGAAKGTGKGVKGTGKGASNHPGLTSGGVGTKGPKSTTPGKGKGKGSKLPKGKPMGKGKGEPRTKKNPKGTAGSGEPQDLPPFDSDKFPIQPGPGFAAMYNGIEKANINAKICTGRVGCLPPRLDINLRNDVAMAGLLPPLVEGSFLRVTGACKRPDGVTRPCIIDGMKRFPVFQSFRQGTRVLARLELRNLIFQESSGSVVRSFVGVLDAQGVTFRRNINGAAVLVTATPSVSPTHIFSNCRFLENTGSAITVMRSDTSISSQPTPRTKSTSRTSNSSIISSNSSIPISSGGSSSNQRVPLLLVVRKSTFRKNVGASAPGVANGGAVSLRGNVPATFEDVQFVENAAWMSGGAVAVTAGAVAFRRCSFVRNGAVNGQGGALFAAVRPSARGTQGILSEVQAPSVKLRAAFCSCWFQGNKAIKFPSTSTMRLAAPSSSNFKQQAVDVSFCNTPVPASSSFPPVGNFALLNNEVRKCARINC